jgi:hypothetical protein
VETGSKAPQVDPGLEGVCERRSLVFSSSREGQSERIEDDDSKVV